MKYIIDVEGTADFSELILQVWLLRFISVMKLSAKNLIGQAIEFIDLLGGKSIINQDFPGCMIIWVGVRVNSGEIEI